VKKGAAAFIKQKQQGRCGFLHRIKKKKACGGCGMKRRENG